MSEKIIIDNGAAQAAGFVLEETAVAIGSDAGCGIRLQDTAVLPRHAMLEKSRGQWRLRALDAARPIESGGRLMPELRLDHGCAFRIGLTTLRFATTHATIQAARSAGSVPENVEQAAGELSRARDRIMVEVGRIIIGQKEVIAQVLTALFSGGHCLLIGAPGLAKTLMVRTLAGALDLDARRIQFTPDLMPADITGTEVLRQDAAGARELAFVPGPVFANVVLADEINRTPPKTQAALLEAMQEHCVTAGGTTHPLPTPFFVLATQNPIEQEGTYPLPEAQRDRFLLAIRIGYPTRADELAIATLDTRERAAIPPSLSIAEFTAFAALVARLPVPAVAAGHAVDLCRASRPEAGADPWVKTHLAWGAGPRATQHLIAAARARAALAGRPAVEVADIRAAAPLVLSHRLVPSFQASAAGIDGSAAVAKLLDLVKP